MSPIFPLPYRLSFVSKQQEQADWAGLTNAWSHDVKYGPITIPCHALVFPALPMLHSSKLPLNAC